MGVYIKGKKKPKDCNACFLGLYDRQAYCRNGVKALCPLVEVKTPHGRLIDAEVIKDSFMEKVQGERLVFDDERYFPTVIEAEVE